MGNIELLNCIYEYAIDECVVSDKSLSKNNLNVLYEVLNEHNMYEFSQQLQVKFNDYIFSNWDFLDRFKIKYNINNLYYVPNANCMQQIFQEKINISNKENDKFYLIFKSYLGHYVLLYTERRKGINYSYCFDSVYGSVEYQPHNKLVNILKENNRILLYPTYSRQCSSIGCFADALTIARDIDCLDLDIGYMYTSYKKNIIMPFLLTHIERFDTMNVLKKQLNEYECHNCVFIPENKEELGLSINFDNLINCEFEYKEHQNGFIIHINEMFNNNVLDGLVRTKNKENYYIYENINEIRTRYHDFLLVDFPERDISLRSKLSGIKLQEIDKELTQIEKQQIKTKIETRLGIILNYHDIYEPDGIGDTILYFNLSNANNAFNNDRHCNFNYK